MKLNLLKTQLRVKVTKIVYIKKTFQIIKVTKMLDIEKRIYRL